MSITVDNGATITKDPSDVLVYTFDWDAANLAAAVTITEFVATITPIDPSTSDTALTKVDSGTGLGIVSSSRKVAIKLSAGTLGQTYRVDCRIVTSETPAQTKERSFFLLIEQH